ncbi:NADP-dependent oxidoreductase domain-containing protein [Limtongia smithiae]|uniref:NADP-dependent oxidoreductase domain-containing protein n=1 Tax=Limtongia smithiae TaxID=1125753 RepID=UPI0034CEE346
MASAKHRVILGMMTFGPASSPSARITTMSDTKAILDRFKGAGYSEIDTARVYTSGDQEAWTAAAGWKDVYHFDIATKCFPVESGMHSKTELPKYLTTSLAELKTDSVGIYYLHAPDRSVPFLETLQTIDALYRQGKFKIFGLSNYAAYEVAEIVTLCRANNLVPPTLYQAKYNCITRSIEPELIPALRHYGLDLVVFNPLCGGLFSGKYNRTTGIPTTGRFSAAAGAQGDIYRNRYFKDCYWDALDLLQPVAEKHNIPLLDIALRWLVHHSKLNLGPAAGQTGDGIIIGVSSPAQLDADIAAIEDAPLPADILAALDAAQKLVMPYELPYWRGNLEYTYDTK